jgi:ABC-type Na+ efflux pump permease subunit
MTRVPVSLLAIGVTAVAGILAALARPGRIDVILGVTVGAGLSGLFTAVALAAFGRIRARGGPDQVTKMMQVFVGLMLARMIAYMALVLASVALDSIEPVSVCVGLVGGTVVFETVEVLYLRKLA